jgi:hypothetical protein
MATVTNTLPVSLTIDPSSLTGEGQYDQATHQVTWSGTLHPGQEHQITYQARPSVYLSPGELIENRVEFYYEDHDLKFERAARSWIAAPDLTHSQVTLQPQVARPGQNISVAVSVHNDGLAGPISASLRFPAEVRPLTGTLQLASGGAHWSDQLLQWYGWLGPGQIMTASVIITTTVSPSANWLPLTTFLDDQFTDPIVVSSLLEVKPYTIYMPLATLSRP